jgi:hypothetical protein
VCGGGLVFSVGGVGCCKLLLSGAAGCQSEYRTAKR